MTIFPLQCNVVQFKPEIQRVHFVVGCLKYRKLENHRMQQDANPLACRINSRILHRTG